MTASHPAVRKERGAGDPAATPPTMHWPVMSAREKRSLHLPDLLCVMSSPSDEKVVLYLGYYSAHLLCFLY